jgi:hypothetical protein
MIGSAVTLLSLQTSPHRSGFPPQASLHVTDVVFSTSVTRPLAITVNFRTMTQLICTLAQASHNPSSEAGTSHSRYVNRVLDWTALRVFGMVTWIAGDRRRLFGLGGGINISLTCVADKTEFGIDT